MVNRKIHLLGAMTSNSKCLRGHLLRANINGKVLEYPLGYVGRDICVYSCTNICIFVPPVPPTGALSQYNQSMVRRDVFHRPTEVTTTRTNVSHTTLNDPFFSGKN